MAKVQARLDATKQQMAAAKAELDKPFPQEEELKTKSARLAELDAELNMDQRAVSREKSAEQEDNPKKEDKMDTIAMTAVYPHDAAYARAHGELAAYRNARRRISPAKTPSKKRLRSISTGCTWTKRVSRGA